MTREEIASKLFDLANELAGGETGHLGAIIHSVVSELNHPDMADAFNMISEVQINMALIKTLKAAKDQQDDHEEQCGKCQHTLSPEGFCPECDWEALDPKGHSFDL